MSILRPILQPVMQPVMTSVDHEYCDGFNPMSLFAGGKKGYTYDFLDRSTLFQDTAGTIPALAIGDPVALVLDKSGNGNHLAQSVSTKRPLVSADGLAFDGVDDCFATVGVVPAEGQSVLVVWGGNWTGNSVLSNLILESSAAASTNKGCFYFLRNDQYTNGISTRVSGNSSDYALWSTTYTPPDKAILALRGRLTGANTLNELWYNGVVKGTRTPSLGATMDFANYVHFVGARNQSIAFYKGSMTSLLCVYKECTDTEVKAMSQFINARMGGVY